LLEICVKNHSIDFIELNLLFILLRNYNYSNIKKNHNYYWRKWIKKL